MPPVATVNEPYLQRFGGLSRLYGPDAARRLSGAHVCVVGVGGVGSWTVEALARSGVGRITMIDMDDVCITNVNRQLHAVDGAIGRPKVQVLVERIQSIHPECDVRAVTEFFTAESAARLLAEPFDFVVDAIDSLANKCLLIASCKERAQPVLTVGGAGGRRDAAAMRVADLAESIHCDLLRAVRRTLRHEYGFPNGKRDRFGVPSVFSVEHPSYPWRDGTCRMHPEPGEKTALDCGSGMGTAAFVTGTFGFVAAGEVVNRLCQVPAVN